ncbi:MAG: hypothetical protein J6M12_04115 [Clostridia bacterium]|nr:hypothetical protein [Clostridia bacterium]
MNNRITIDVIDLENEKELAIRYYKKQLEAFHSLKKEIERVNWSDARYDALVNCMNDIGLTLTETLGKISNGYDVYAISDTLPLAYEYLENAKRFPII